MQQFFAQSGITIDSDFARFGTKSFSVGKITSIDVRSTRPGELAGGVLIAIGVLVSIFGLLALLTGTFVLSVVLAIGVPLLIYGVQLANERAFF